MSKVEITVPSAGESVSEATIASFIAKPGSYVKADEDLLELETDKASMELPSPAAGVFEPTAKEGDTVAVGAVIGHINTDAKAPKPVPEKPEKEVKKEEPQQPKAPKEAPTAEAIKPQPPVQGGGGIREPMDAYLKDVSEQKAKPQAKQEEQKGTPQGKQEERKGTPQGKQEESKDIQQGKERKKMSKMRQTIASRLVQVKQETAMLTTFNEVDMSALVDLRKREKDNFLKKHGVKLTYLPFFIKASISALREFPDVGASIEGTDMVYSDGAHIGIAVSTDKGLVVPVMRHANKMSFLEITHAITDLATKARDRKLTMDDMSGGTFTITNGGVFGSMLSTPILNAPQSAILGMHNIVERAVAISGKVEVRPVMYLALSYDHRAIDGKESVQFLVHIKKMLEDPTRMLLEG